MKHIIAAALTLSLYASPAFAAEWYEGSHHDLAKATLAQWHKASYHDRLVTAGDMLSALSEGGNLKYHFKSMDEVKYLAANLVAQIDKSASVRQAGSQKVSDIATMIVVMAGWTK